MADPETNRQQEIQEVLVNALEVQLAALKASIGFWREWIERTSAFVKTATQTLGAIRSRDKNAKQVLLEMVDESRESMRAMTELPRNAAARFIRELDEMEKKRKAGKGGRPRGKARGAAAPARPKRRVRAKP